MKIKVVYTSSFPNGSVGASRAFYISKGLIESGATVDVLITNPTEDFEKPLNSEPAGVHQNVHYKYINNWIYRNKNIFIRKFIDLICHITVVFCIAVNKEGYDTFIILGTGIDFRILLPFTKYLNRAQIVLEINEYPFVTKKNNQLTKIKRVILFNYIFPEYAGFIVISTLLDRLVKKYKSTKAFTLIVPPVGESVNISVNCAKKFVNPYVIHSGSISEKKDGILGILKALDIVRKLELETLSIVITGNNLGTKDQTEMLEYISNNGISDMISFTGFIDRPELECLLFHSSLAIINKYNNTQNQFCFPTKITEYINYEVPMILTAVGDISNYFTNGLNAVVIEPDNIDQLVEGVHFLLNNPDQGREFARNAKCLASTEFNYFFQGKRILNCLLNEHLPTDENNL